eukprot:15364944-Ditylum_brightwellii.AAC.1
MQLNLLSTAWHATPPATQLNQWKFMHDIMTSIAASSAQSTAYPPPLIHLPSTQRHYPPPLTTSTQHV